MAEKIPAAEGTAEKPKRKQVNRQNIPRPAYVLVKVPEGVNVDDIEVINVTRKAEEALAAQDADRDVRYLRIMVK